LIARLKKRDYKYLVKWLLMWCWNQVKNPIIRLNNDIRGGLPIPPSELIYLVAGTDDVDWFLKSGKLAANNIRETLLRNQINLERLDTILDFGCGVGRVVRHWKGLGHLSICGIDYNAELIRWCQKNLSFAEFKVNELTGALAYERDTFDFVYALSVFTHLTESQQLFWMAEMLRILKPGGFLLITTHGEHYISQLKPRDQELFRKGQMVVYNEDKAGSNKCVAYHPEYYVRNVLAKDFVIIDFTPKGALGNPEQDLYLLKKS